MGFSKLALSENIQKTLREEGYETPTPIQAEAIPHVLAGRDVLGIAQTGTGKTAAFALPIIHRLLDPSIRKAAPAGHAPAVEPHAVLEGHHEGGGGVARPQAADGGGESLISKSARKTRALILSPTRELAGQIEESFRTYGRGTPLRVAVIFGGVSQDPQVKALRHGVDVVVATPGRLLDLINQGLVDLRHVRTFVLDEADQMMDMGFIYDIRKIVQKLPEKRQSLMFSATMPPDIRKLADTILVDPVTITVSRTGTAAETVDHAVLHLETPQKPAALVSYIKAHATGRTLVFTRTKRGADKVVKHLENFGIRAAALHANKSQSQRKRAMVAFKGDRPPVMVATDIASRGLDINEITHVINFNVPNVPETYVHRIGRTGRAGAEGTAISFCDGEERAYLRDIEKLLGKRVPVLRPDFTRDPNQPTELPAKGERRERQPQRPAEPRQVRPAPADGEDRGNDAGDRSHDDIGDAERAGERPRRQDRPAHGGARPGAGKPFMKPPVGVHKGGPRKFGPGGGGDGQGGGARPPQRSFGGPSGARPNEKPRVAAPAAHHRDPARRPGGGTAGTSGPRVHGPAIEQQAAPAPRHVQHGPRPAPRPASAKGGYVGQNTYGKPPAGKPVAKPGFAKPGGFGAPPESGGAKPGGKFKPRGGGGPVNQWGYRPNSAGGKSQGKRK